MKSTDKKTTKKINLPKEEEQEISKKIEIEKEENIDFIPRHAKQKKKTHPCLNFFLALVLVSSIGYFLIPLFYQENQINHLEGFIGNFLLVLFTIFFVCLGFTSNRRKNGSIWLGSFLLLAYFIFSTMVSFQLISLPTMNQVVDFRGKSLTDVITWASKHDITVIQDYEYSDMVEEYQIISQDVKEGTNLKDIKSITVSISEGVNPYKEVIVPNMISWNSEQVIQFVKDNYLTNVEVEFVSSDKAEDTVIEQSKSGNLRREEKIKLTFSYGEELDYSEVKLIDFTGKSEFEVEFYLKQHHLKYEFDRDFSKKIKRGLAMKQNKKAGEMIPIDNEEEKIKVTFSKGKEISVPNLKKMSIAKITNWIIENKLKLEFDYAYDESLKENTVIRANHKKGDIIEQGEAITIVISKGTLKMPKFSSYEEFRKWAEKYQIPYEEKHEFNNQVKAGEVISYSYKTGDVIKNGDVIIVTISDGEKIKVPDLEGLTKSEAISKLKKLNLEYNFVYRNSSKVKKDIVMGQSVDAGSEVSKGTTITVTLSSGEEEKEEPQVSSSNSSSSNKKPSNTPSTPSCDRSKTAELNIQAGSNGAQTKSMIEQLNPKHKFNFVFVSACDNGDSSPGTVCTTGLEGVAKNFCDTITVQVVK